jgi:manganese transport protein
MAGQMILEGFMQVRFSIFLRRLLTLLPAVIVIAIGLDPLRILLLSQAALSFTLPFALVPLLILTQRANVMHRFVNGRVVQSLGWLSTSVILSLNAVLVWQMFRG